MTRLERAIFECSSTSILSELYPKSYFSDPSMASLYSNQGQGDKVQIYINNLE